MATEMGRIAGLLEGPEASGTPLQRRLDRVSQRLVFLCAAIVTVIFGLGLLRGEGLFTMLLAALSLAVAAIPEGLPTVVTLALAVGVQRMARRHALVRQMAAVETLGAAEVIASDKTGTLTTGVLAVRRLVLAPGGGDQVRRRLRHAAVAASEASLRGGSGVPVVTGDPTEAALLLDAAAAGIERDVIEIEQPRLFVLPFDSDRKRMSIARRTTAGPMLFLKGAPELVLPRCARVATEAGDAPLDDAGRAALHETTQALAGQALRVLAVAERRLGDTTPHRESACDTTETDLTFLGLVALADTPRPEARSAVARCAVAGIRVVMITGDHPITAAAIARELGILGTESGGRVLDGRALDALDDDGLVAAATHARVYARVTPAHKLRIVRALKRGGRVVAMTGDGVNDAPAVREASVGIAMGRTGTDVTRQAADIVITDDNFASIVNAVEEGRRIFDNIQRTLLYLLAGNLGEVLVMLAAAVAGWPVPFLPVHLLWVNLVTDGMPALALATERAHAHALRRPPRPAGAEFVDRPFLRRVMLAGSLIAAVSITAFFIGQGGTPGGVASGRALALAALVTSHITWAFAARSRTRTHFSLGAFSNLRLLAVLVGTLGLQVMVQSLPAVSTIFGTPPLGWREWRWALALGLLPVTVIELSKIMRRADPSPPGA
jgi:Ca2+-transporting ATPase